MSYRTEAPAPPRDRTISFEDTDCIMTTDTNEPDYSDHFCIEQEEDGHRYHVLSFGGETHYETRREAIEAAREYGNTAELERLAARVAELKRELTTAHRFASEANDVIEAMGGAKLRAAAAPVELPEGWVVDECGDMLGPKGAEVYSDKGRTWIYNSDVDSACAAPTDVLRRHLLGTSDVRAPELPVGWTCHVHGVYMTDETRGYKVTVNDNGDTVATDYIDATELHAVLAHHLSRPTAPRTEGGGE